MLVSSVATKDVHRGLFTHRPDVIYMQKTMHIYHVWNVDSRCLSLGIVWTIIKRSKFSLEWLLTYFKFRALTKSRHSLFEGSESAEETDQYRGGGTV